MNNIEEEKEKELENKNWYKDKCLRGYCISLVTQPEPGVHTFPISYNKPWEEIWFSSSLRKFGDPVILNHILWDRAANCEGNWV